MSQLQQYFNDLAKLSDDIYFLLDERGRVLELSANAEKMLGFPAAQMVGNLLDAYLHPTQVSFFTDQLEYAKTCPKADFELLFLRPHKLFQLTKWSLIYNSVQNIYFGKLNFMKSSEVALKKILDRLNFSLRAANMAIWEIELNKNQPKAMKAIWDEEMFRIHGAHPSEEPLNWFYSHITPEDLKNLQETLRDHLQQGNFLLQFSYKFRWPNGELHYIDLYGRLEQIGTSDMYRMYGVARDVTEDTIKQSMLDDQKNRMISTSRMAILGEMSSGIAHEINNPLTVIQARSFQLAQMVDQNKIDTTKIKSAADSISKTADKIAKIVKSLRAFAHSQDSDPLDVVRVQELVQETLDFCKIRFYNHGIDIRVGDIPEGLEFECRLVQIEEVLLNLFNNSHDAIMSLEDKWILIEAFDRDEEVEIHITDSGKGIPAEIADKMMLPFFTTKEIGKGTGLGLSIVAEIVHNHHGELYLDRTSPNTRFVLKFPKFQGAK